MNAGETKKAPLTTIAENWEFSVSSDKHNKAGRYSSGFFFLKQNVVEESINFYLCPVITIELWLFHEIMIDSWLASMFHNQEL